MDTEQILKCVELKLVQSSLQVELLTKKINLRDLSCATNYIPQNIIQEFFSHDFQRKKSVWTTGE